jgi:hypothetical protein
MLLDRSVVAIVDVAGHAGVRAPVTALDDGGGAMQLEVVSGNPVVVVLRLAYLVDEKREKRKKDVFDSGAAREHERGGNYKIEREGLQCRSSVNAGVWRGKTKQGSESPEQGGEMCRPCSI